MPDGPDIAETPRQKLAQKAREIDIQAANDSARAATQASILINGGAATAILAFLSTYLSKSPTPPMSTVQFASLSLGGYALGVCFGALSMWYSSQASAKFGLSWETTLDSDNANRAQHAAQYMDEGNRLLSRHRLCFALSILLFFISSGMMGWGFILG